MGEIHVDEMRRQEKAFEEDVSACDLTGVARFQLRLFDVVISRLTPGPRAEYEAALAELREVAERQGYAGTLALIGLALKELAED